MRSKAGAAAALLPVLLLAVLALLPALPVDARTPTVQVAISQEEVKVDGSLGGPLAARFGGSISVMNNELQTADVTITIDAGSWVQSVTPSEKVVTGNESFTFSAVVNPPADAAEGRTLVRVIARAESPGSSPGVAQGSVSVWIVRNRVRIDPQPAKEAQPGKSVNFALKVYNDGSARDTFVSAVEQRQGPRDRISFLLDQGSLDVEGDSFVYMNVQVELSANATPGTYEARFSVQSTSTNSSSSITLSVIVPPPPIREGPAQAGLNYYLILGISLAVLGVCLMIFIGGTEIGLLAFLQFILVPLFVRIKKDRVLDHFTRGQIYGFIKANPGTHYIAIQEHLELQNGVLAYHLKVLEREDYIVSERDSIYKRFYPRHMKIPRKERQLSRVQLDIISALRTHPGTSQNGLARMLGESKQVIGYHVRVLEKAGIVRVERDPQMTRCYLAGELTSKGGETEQPPEHHEEPPAHEMPEIIKEIRA